MEIVWDADFTSAKNLRKEKRNNHFKGQQTTGKGTGKVNEESVAFCAPDFVNFVEDMAEQARHSWDPPGYASEPSEAESESSDSDEDPTFETTVAAAYLGLDPFETCDQDDHLAVRAEVSVNARTEELYDKWVETIKKLYPDDEEWQKLSLKVS